MRQYFLLMCVFALSFSCKNSQPQPNSLIGNWQWIKNTGGIAGMTIVANEENGYNLIFETPQDFKLEYKNGKSVSSKYSITEEESLLNKKMTKIINFENSFYPKCSFYFSDDKLVLIDEAFDGFSHTFVRQQ